MIVEKSTSKGNILVVHEKGLCLFILILLLNFEMQMWMLFLLTNMTNTFKLLIHRFLQQVFRYPLRFIDSSIDFVCYAAMDLMLKQQLRMTSVLEEMLTLMKEQASIPVQPIQITDHSQQSSRLPPPQAQERNSLTSSPSDRVLSFQVQPENYPQPPQIPSTNYLLSSQAEPQNHLSSPSPPPLPPNKFLPYTCRSRAQTQNQYPPTSTEHDFRSRVQPQNHLPLLPRASPIDHFQPPRQSSRSQQTTSRSTNLQSPHSLESLLSETLSDTLLELGFSEPNSSTDFFSDELSDDNADSVSLTDYRRSRTPPPLSPPLPQIHSQQQAPVVPQPPFSTPPKLLPVERILEENPGKGETQLRQLTTALARDVVFGREALEKCSLSGRKRTDTLDPKKVDYIKSVIRSRVPEMGDVVFECLWTKCRQSLSKSCQALRTKSKKLKL